MIKSITVTNHLGDSIKLDLARPELSGFAVTSISGLGPGKATINTSEVATDDGSSYNSARLPQRNIVISLKYLWKPTIEAMRYQSYKYFPIKKKVKLLIETDTRLAEIEGYVESNDPTIFSRSEGSNISIICPDPFFYAAGEDGINTAVFSGIDPAFEFPFSNNSNDEPTINMGDIISKTEQVIAYTGDSEIGITINIHALGVARNITVHNTVTREVMCLDSSKIEATTGSGIIAGDDIIINTVKKNKSVVLIRDGKMFNILNCLTKDSKWFKLTRGDNIFAFTAAYGDTNLQFEIKNRIVYEGV